MKIKTRFIWVTLAIVVVLGAVITWRLSESPAKPVLTGATPVGSMTAGKDGLPTLDATLATAGIKRFKLLGGPGEMDISASDDGEVHVSLELRQQQHSLLWLFHWLSNDTARDLKSATLRQARDGDILTVALAYPSGEYRSDIQERWKVSVPARLALDADLYAGELKIEGMEGSIRAHLKAGELRIQSPGGSIHAAVDYGRLKVNSDSGQPGTLSVHSEHGLAVLSLDGKYYGPAEDHGFMGNVHLVGNDVTEHRPGKDDMDLSVYAGAVSLQLGALQDDEQTYRDLFTD